MRTLIPFLLVVAPLLLPAAELESGVVEQVEAALTATAPKLRSSVVAVQRPGRLEVAPAVRLKGEGILLAPFLPTVDDRDDETPYLVLLNDGSRRLATIIAKHKRRNIVLLNVDDLPDHVTPAPIAPDDRHLDTAWYLRPSIATSLLIGEPIQLHLEHLVQPGDNSADRCLVTSPVHFGGTPLFDLTGALLGVVDANKKDGATTRLTPLVRLRKEVAELANHLATPTTNSPPNLPILLPNADQRKADEQPVLEALQASFTNLVQNVPVVAISNQGAPSVGIHGVIVSSDGFILSKASHIGPSPSVNWNDQDYPAVLVAEDESTDLALLLIDAEDLPILRWKNVEPAPYSLLGSPLRITTPPLNAPVVTGWLSHTLAPHIGSPASAHHAEQGTSLGIVTEQLSDGLIVAAVATNSPSHGVLQQSDRIQRIGDTAITNRAALLEALAEKQVGKTVQVTIKRDNITREVSVQLARAKLAPPLSGEFGNAARMLPSLHRSGLPTTLVHNQPLFVWQCGTPLFTRSGELVGLNIAVAGLGRTLALPAEEVRKALDRLLAHSIEF